MSIPLNTTVRVSSVTPETVGPVGTPVPIGSARQFMLTAYGGRWLTTGEVCRVTGLSRSAVVRLCDRGTLASERVEGDAAGRRVMVESLASLTRSINLSV